MCCGVVWFWGGVLWCVVVCCVVVWCGGVWWSVVWCGVVSGAVCVVVLKEEWEEGVDVEFKAREAGRVEESVCTLT